MDTKPDFNFDEWARLAKEEPERFESLRQEAIQKLIDKASEKIRPRMQGLQWQIDQHRSTAKTPIASCIKISSLMWDKVLGENGLVESIEQLSKPANYVVETDKQKATILKFEQNETEEKQKNEKYQE